MKRAVSFGLQTRCPQHDADDCKCLKHPLLLFPTLSRGMADVSNSWRAGLFASVHQNKSIRTTNSIFDQVQHFVHKPAAVLTVSGPILWVIDGLDSIQDRGLILRALSTLLTQLPQGLKILVTSTIEADIYQALEGRNHIAPLFLHDFDDIVNRRRIPFYIADRLDVCARMCKSPALKNWRSSSLASTATDDAYFNWATLATPLIHELSGVHPKLEDEMLGLLNTAPCLHDLYVNFVKLVEIQPREPFTPISCVETLVASPGSGDPTTNYTATLELLYWVDRLLPRLSSDLCKWITGDESSIDFPATSRIRLDVSLAQACFHIMECQLQLNVTQCGSSYVLNKDQSDADMPTLNHSLTYACRFWFHHLKEQDAAENLSGLLERFLVAKLLFWLEVMSILGKMDDAASMLRELLSPDCIKVRGYSVQYSGLP